MSAEDTAKLHALLDLTTHPEQKMRPDPTSPGVARLDHFSGLFLERGAAEGEWTLEGRSWGKPGPEIVHEWHLLAAQAARQLDAQVTLPKPLPHTPARDAGSPARTGGERAPRASSPSPGRAAMSTPAAATARRLDPASRAWLSELRREGPAREAAVARLHTLLLKEARHEVRRRSAGLAHPSGRDLDDLAVQAADDAVVAVLAKLGRFRGDALFTTWARRFATLEVPGEIRRRRGHTREIPSDPEDWPPARAASEDPEQRTEASELARTVGGLIAHELTPHQRRVLIAMALEETPAKALAERLHSTPGALYKTLHDARRKLRDGLTPEPADRHDVVPAEAARRLKTAA